MRLFKLLTVTLAFGMSSLALGYAHTQTPVDCDKANFYSGDENTREPAQNKKRVKLVLTGKAQQADIVQSADLPSKQTR